MFFEELNDDEWARIAALAADEPVHPHRRGRPRAETRVVTNAVLWILTTGERWSKLPARYPSGPTCRRRFDEWLADGTLIEIVRVLSETGRAFAYVPQPQPVAQSAPKPAPAPESPRLRGVFWTNPESWQAANGACANTCHTSDVPIASSRPFQVPGTTLRMREQAHDVPLLNATSTDKLTQDYRGYTIQAQAQAVAKHTQLTYRASAELLKDGRRIERSGLIGPSFADHESAERHALEWAQDWIDRHESAAAAAAAALASQAQAAEPVGEIPIAPAVAERALAAPITAMTVASTTTRSLDSAVITTRAAHEWLLHSDSHGDAKPPELLYHA
ncbi:transposase [Trinickia fusca]|uniref:Transposase n=1 Tax=Trinickia fusca TaxID=2419777 RepID=A0A494XLQ3_9BURK|nr:DUF6566 family protein [Trinickia fusca]RKP48483.1 transposase [Trinickia fusca]